MDPNIHFCAPVPIWSWGGADIAPQPLYIVSLIEEQKDGWLKGSQDSRVTPLLGHLFFPVADQSAKALKLHSSGSAGTAVFSPSTPLEVSHCRVAPQRNLDVFREHRKL